MKNYYDILGVSKNASSEEIKVAYRALAKKYHPDISKENNSDIFKEIAEAYEILGNIKKKKKYDLKTDANVDPIFNEVFSTIFSNIKKDPYEDLVIVKEIIIPVTKLFSGTKETISYTRKILDSNRKEITVTTVKEIEIKKGSQSSDLKIYIKNGGHESKKFKGIFGNLQVIVRVMDIPPLYMRYGNDIVSDIFIPLNLSLVGETIELPTLHGIKDVFISPKNCFFEKTPLVLKGYGLQKGIDSKEFGDHLFKISIEIPKTLTEDQINFFKKMPIEENVYPEYSRLRKFIMKAK